MSLGIAIKSPSGIVLAAESRVTLQTDHPLLGHPLYVSYDNAVKLFGLGEAPHNFVGVVTYGAAAIGLRTAHSYLPEIQATLPPHRLTIQEYAETIGRFFAERWGEAIAATGGGPYQGSPMTFWICGFNDGASYGEIYELNLPYSAAPAVRQRQEDFGIHWGGQREFVDRLMLGYDPRIDGVLQAAGVTPEQRTAMNHELRNLEMQIPIVALPLQDCVDLAIFFVRTTVAGQRFTAGVRGCGGPIDVATITRSDGIQFVQQKTIQGEFRDGSEALFPA